MKFINSFVLLVLAHYCIGQSAFKVDVNRDTIYLGNTVTISFITQNLQQKPDVPELPFQIVSGPNQSMSSSYINGEGSTTNTISYILMPENPGIYQIDPIKLVGSDSIYVSEKVDIIVLDNPEGIVQQDKMSHGFGSFFGSKDFFNVPPQKAKKKSKPKRKMKRI